MEKLNNRLMDTSMLSRLPDGKWEYRVDEDEKVVFAAEDKEEAERMAEAYLNGDEEVAKRVVRMNVEKPRSGLVAQED